MKTRHSRGSALLESALMITATLVTLFGVIDAGQFYFLQATVAERVRAGLRYSAVHAFDAAAIRNVVVYNSSVPSGTAKPLFGLRTSMISVANTTLGSAGSRITITVSGYPLALYGPVFARKFPAFSVTGGILSESMGALQ